MTDERGLASLEGHGGHAWSSQLVSLVKTLALPPPKGEGRGGPPCRAFRLPAPGVWQDS